MAPKTKERRSSSDLQDKAYKDHLAELYSSTALQPRDIDQKATLLLDALEAAGKGEAGCQHLKTQLEGVTRDKVQNMRAYVYSLLRSFDSDVYNEMKEKAGGSASRRAAGNKGKYDKSTPGQNPNAVEFVPGSWWGGDAAPGSIAPQMQPMGYPMMNMMMGQMMYQQQMPTSPTNRGPPPPPGKAADVPKAADSTAPAPDKPADATVVAEAKEGGKPAAEAKEGEKP